MAKPDLYNITIATRSGITDEQVQKVMDNALDWLHYAPNAWFVWTSVDAKKWYDRLKPLVVPGGIVMICKCDPKDYFGFGNKAFWPWLKKYKDIVANRPE